MKNNSKIRGRNRKPAERAIIFASLLGGLSLERTRELLKEAGYGDRDLPERSWILLKDAYLPKFKENLDFVGESIFFPKTMNNLCNI